MTTPEPQTETAAQLNAWRGQVLSDDASPEDLRSIARGLELLTVAIEDAAELRDALMVERLLLARLERDTQEHEAAAASAEEDMHQIAVRHQCEGCGLQWAGMTQPDATTPLCDHGQHENRVWAKHVVFKTYDDGRTKLQMILSDGRHATCTIGHRQSLKLRRQLGTKGAAMVEQWVRKLPDV